MKNSPTSDSNNDWVLDAPDWFRKWQNNHFVTLNRKVDKLIVEYSINRNLIFLVLAAIIAGYILKIIE